MNAANSSRKQPRRVPFLFVLCAMFVIIMVGWMWIDSLNGNISQLEVIVSDATISSELLKRESDSLSNELDQSQTKDYIIATARQRYHYIMPNELVFVVKNPEALGDLSLNAEVIQLEELQP